MRTENKKYYSIVFGATLGNIMEFFDFMIYVFLANELANNFFPTNNETISLLLVFSAFASGYLSRPIGAIVFGKIGDQYGRKKALSGSILIMTLSTTMIGLLPTYSAIGITSPILLTILRIIQGLAVSGEEGGAIVYLYEFFGESKKGFCGSLILGSVYIGVLLSNLTCNAALSLYYDWSWRLPFLVSLPIGIICFILRIKSCESPKFKQRFNFQIKVTSPSKELFATGKAKIFSSCLLVAPQATAIYYFLVCIPHLTKKFSSMDILTQQFLTISAILGIIIFVPIIGWLSDKKKNYYVIIYLSGILLLGILSIPILYLLHLNTPFCYFMAQLAMGLCVSLLSATVFSFIMDIFVVQQRYTATSLAFNTSTAIFGCTSPAICISLIDRFGYMPSALHLVIVSGLGLLGLTLHLNLKKTEDVRSYNNAPRYEAC